MREMDQREAKDMLRHMFQMQEQLNRRIGVEPRYMDEKTRQEWLLNFCRAMSQEIAELTDSVPWKWWAHYQKFDLQNARVEIIDLLHFLISAAQVLGMQAPLRHRQEAMKTWLRGSSARRRINRIKR